MALNKYAKNVVKNKTLGYANADDAFGNTTKSTLNKKDETYVTDISDPNMLHEFASYNTIFTLSALSQEELERPGDVLRATPHDIIAKSGGIGPNENRTRNPVSADNKKIIEKNERLQGAIDKSLETLGANRDLYFRNVSINAIPGLNDKRRLTSVTQINMEIVEPFGISLLERIRAAAINNDYLDHLDAPYLLTIEFVGFDELGNQATDKLTQAMKRVIPVKLVDMNMDVSQAGTVYNLKAIPYNEFPYLNVYNWPRTSGQLNPEGKTLESAVKKLEQLLNQQNEDENEQGQNELPDKYVISIHEDLAPEKLIQLSTVPQSGMAQGATGADAGFYVGTGQEVPPDYMKFNSNMSIIKILEEIMKGHPDYTDKKFAEFYRKASKELGVAEFKGGAGAVLEAAEDFYFKYFKIRASIIPISKEFDTIRATHRKIIKFAIEPYYVHAYSLAIPGVSTGQNFKNFVFKKYNYTFTGENVDILDLDIKYRVAYFQSRLKDFEADNKRKNKIDKIESKNTGGTTGLDIFGDGSLILKSEPSVAKSEGTGKTGGTPSELDSFLDSLTHPLADMVNVRLEILGDPAWMGQSQYIPAAPEIFSDAKAIHKDSTIDYWRGNRKRIWNDELRCYNADVAEPIMMLNFRMPTDLNDLTGVYELQKDQSAEFSGLYRVVTTEHNFSDGRYTTVLNLTRFNNQGVNISNPVPTATVISDGVASKVVTQVEANSLVKEAMSAYKEVTNIGRKFQELISKIKGYFG